MSTWSGIKNKLETDYLAPSLKGRIQYFVTRYRLAHDQEGRAAILLDGEEILKGNFYNFVKYEHLLPKEQRQEKWNLLDETTIDLGMFDQRSFYFSFDIFDNQSIEKSLESDNLLVRIFAVLDRRVGKRRLVAMSEKIGEVEPIFKLFYLIRLDAEGIKIA